ncbi:hypothetical protein FA15DRAFT_158357 [Coprinopsis marcescibilis]|uniref:CBM1 domain-containing protein n=1 Tax=Coprinopsis marcescibilis TaxID=230819 RepID=A0A5C3L4Q5_COPMA|nr:hypothetical protein FA15DRAFT_158357 [Coprinopsis marcescibilis]
MLSTTFRALSLFSILASTALAGEICTFAGTNCEGLFGCCTSLAEGTCCAWRTGTSLGWSVQVGKVESEAWVTTLSRDLNCSGQHGLGQGESDGSVCKYPNHHNHSDRDCLIGRYRR